VERPLFNFLVAAWLLSGVNDGYNRIMLHLILLALALALLQNPGEQAALEIIRTALSQGDLDSAESAAQEVIRNYPNNAQVHYLLAGIRPGSYRGCPFHPE